MAGGSRQAVRDGLCVHDMVTAGDRAAEHLDKQQQHPVLEGERMSRSEGTVRKNPTGLYDLLISRDGVVVDVIRNLNLRVAAGKLEDMLYLSEREGKEEG